MGNAASKLIGGNKLAQVLPATTDVEATSPDGVKAITAQLLAQTSMAGVDALVRECPSAAAVFRTNKLRVLRNLVAPTAWEDAVACVDRRLRMGRAARRAFDRDYAAGTVSRCSSEEEPPDDGEPATDAAAPDASADASRPPPGATDRGQWDLDDLCELVRVIDTLLARERQKTHATLEEWEASWRCARPRRDVHAYRPVPVPVPGCDRDRDAADWTLRDPAGGEHRYEDLCRDHGTEDPDNFEYAFRRHTKLDHAGVRYEGVQTAGPAAAPARARLQRALFRLELLRRRFYRRPLFPADGARFRSRTATVREGVFGVAGEVRASRLARADAVFRRWAAPDDFCDVVCAFKATLNEYAVPVSRAMEDFMVAVEDALDGDADQRRAEAVCETRRRRLATVARAVGLRWETDPLTDGEDLRTWGVEPDERFYDLRARLRDDSEQLDALEAARLIPLGRFGFDGRRATMFRSERGRATPRNKRERADPSQRVPARETNPELAMARFFHILCSLPLRFLGEFMAMPEPQQRSFLKTSYWALARVKASHTPLFLSGEMSAWSSEPASGSAGQRRWDHKRHPRLFPELSVRAAAIACVCNVYECQTHPAMGFRVRADEKNGGWRWRWDDRGVTPAVWERIRAEVGYKSVDINGVFGMSPASWAAVWRSDREFERQLWTGPMAERERWEGYGHAGRLDPNECYCRQGDNCAMCLPLPDTELPEWELLTEKELREEIEEIKYFKYYSLECRYPELAESVADYKKTHKAVLY